MFQSQPLVVLFVLFSELSSHDKRAKGHSVVSLIKDTKPIHEGFPGGSVVKNPPANQETLVRSLGQEDPLE